MSVCVKQEGRAARLCIVQGPRGILVWGTGVHWVCMCVLGERGLYHYVFICGTGVQWVGEGGCQMYMDMYVFVGIHAPMT